MANTRRSGHSYSMKIANDVRKCLGEQGIPEEDDLRKGMEEKIKVFNEKVSDLYAKA